MPFLTDKYPRTMHFHFSPGAKNDDRIATSLDEMRLLSKDLVYTEKLDGENTCIKQDGIYARTHSVVNRNEWAHYLWSKWATIKNELHGLEIFGENMYAVHSIEYQRLPDYFFVFAIRDGDLWYEWDEVKWFANYFNFSVVPEFPVEMIMGNLNVQVHKMLPIREVIGLLMTMPNFGNSIEGVVVRNRESFTTDEFDYNVLKYVRKDHVQTDEHWTKHWKKAKLINGC